MANTRRCWAAAREWWDRQVTAAWTRRAASYGAASVIVALAVAVLGCGWYQARLVTQGADAARSAEAYEHARRVVTAAHLDQEPFTGRRDQLEAQAGHLRALADAERALVRLRDQGTDEDDGAKLDEVIDAQRTDLVHVRRYFALVDAGLTDDADELAERSIEPLEWRIQIMLNALTEKNQGESSAAFNQLRATASLLWKITPVAITAALLLVLLFSMVNRWYQVAVQVQASRDGLTGLPNRTAFQQRCAEALAGARRTGEEPAVLLLDLDNFKHVNDTLGHGAGDALLLRVADRLSATVRDGDTAARMGGDEFAVLVPHGGRTAATNVADRIVAELHRPITIEGVTLDLEVSVGVAVAEPGTDAQTLVRHADTAMYLAKEHKPGVAHYSADQDQNTVARLALLGELRRALTRDEIVLHYQPQVSVDTDSLVGVEALARWQHSSRGLLPPAEFVDVVDSTSLSHAFAEYVIDKALRHTRDWLDRGIRLPVAVNISTRCLLDPRLPETVAALLQQAAVPAELLCLEITESTIMTDPDRALDVLRRIRALGVAASIDDFGTGYSSMSYLKLLPVNELKIDRSFVRDMATDATNAILVQSTVDLGHNLGLYVTAEGVEDEATLAELRRLGCDVAQGYHLARPLPPAQLAAWLESRYLDTDLADRHGE